MQCPAIELTRAYPLSVSSFIVSLSFTYGLCIFNYPVSDTILKPFSGIQFGTAGLRGRMSAGFSRMNCLTVIQTSQGLAKYLKEDHGPASKKGVVIGYDARHNSAKYASLAANAFIAQGIPVWVYPSCSPTPTVPYGVLYQKAVAGIMVTASHVSIISYYSMDPRK